MPVILAIAATLLLTTALALSSPPLARADNDDGKLILVLDSSGSMKEPASGGQAKIDAAKQALNKVVDTLPDDAQVGMRVYGAKVFDQSKPGACEDSQRVVDIGTDNRDQLKQQIAGYKPFGETPIAYALEQAAADLGTTGKRSILLVSDGEETCVPDPCAVAKKIADTGIDLRIDVVGFRVSGKAQEQLSCIAKQGKGSYYDVSDADELAESVEQVQRRAARPLEFTGTPITGSDIASTAPPIGVGQWVDETGQDTTTKFYRVGRSTPDSTLWVGVQLRTGTTAGVGDLNLELTAADGTECDSADTNSYGGGDNSLLTGSVSSAADKPSCTQGEVILEVNQYAWTSGGSLENLPFQITVLEEPPVTNANALTAAPEPVWQQPSGGKRQDVEGGTSTAAAPVVEPGTVSGTIVPNEIQLYKVRLGWGQRVLARLEAPDQPDYPSGNRVASLAVLNPLGGRVESVVTGAPARDNVSLYSSTSGENIDLATGTPEVRWPNRSASTAYQAAAIPGDYFIAVSYTGEAAEQERKFDLGVQVIGEAGSQAPQYAELTEPTAAPTAQQPPATAPPPNNEAAQPPAEPAVPNKGNAALPWAIGGGAAAVLVLAGLGVGYRLLTNGRR